MQGLVPSIARLFVTAKGYGDVAVVVIIGPDGSGAQGPGELTNTRIIAASKRSAQAVVSVIGHRYTKSCDI